MPLPSMSLPADRMFSVAMLLTPALFLRYSFSIFSVEAAGLVALRGEVDVGHREKGGGGGRISGWRRGGDLSGCRK